MLLKGLNISRRIISLNGHKTIGTRPHSLTTTIASTEGRGGSLVLFPGQGAQAIGMGVDVAKQNVEVRSLFDCASSILGRDLLHICEHGPKALLDSTEISQPAIFVASMAAVVVAREKYPDIISNCTATAGLSLGEYSALCFAGILSFDEALRLTVTRGKCMQMASEQAPSAMVSLVGRPIEIVQGLIDKVSQSYPNELFIANYLAPDNFTVAGSEAACALAKSEAKSHGIKLALRLPVSGAFHTHYMGPAAEPFKAALDKAVFGSIETSKIRVYSNVTGEYHTDATIKENMLRQLTSPVQWDAIMSHALSSLNDSTPASSEGVRVSVLEAGPGSVCASLLKRRKVPAGLLDIISVTV